MAKKISTKLILKKGQSLFNLLEREAFRAGITSRTVQSRKWFKRKIKELGRVSRTRLMRDEDRLRSKFKIGRMYLYVYDPKWKKTLPYYDRFPLTIPIELRKDGFLGLNLHYLPPKLRAQLLDQLITLANNKKFNETTKLKITYNILNNAARFKAFKPTIHRYLANHIKSQFLEIPAFDWDAALFLDVADWKKASQAKVWRDSRNKIR